MKVKIIFMRIASVLSISYSCLQRTIPFLFLFLILDFGVIGVSNAAGQNVPGQTANPRSETGGANADFLFGEPAGFFGFSVGIFSPQAGSDLFDMVMRELTIKKSDFRAFNIGIDCGFRMYERSTLFLTWIHRVGI